MPRTAHIRQINPRVDVKVKEIILSKDKEVIYDKKFIEGGLKELGLYVRYVREREDGVYACVALIDYIKEIPITVREKDKLKKKMLAYLTSTEIIYYVFPILRGSSQLNNIVAILSNEALASLLNNAISKIVGLQAFLRVKFNFSPSTESRIRQEFDDISVLKAEDIDDDRIYGIRIKGIRLYETGEYQKGFSGRVETLGISIGERWFLINAYGKITTYQSISDDMFIDYVKEILKRLLRARAVII